MKSKPKQVVKPAAKTMTVWLYRCLRSLWRSFGPLFVHAQLQLLCCRFAAVLSHFQPSFSCQSHGLTLPLHHHLDSWYEVLICCVWFPNMVLCIMTKHPHTGHWTKHKVLRFVQKQLCKPQLFGRVLLATLPNKPNLFSLFLIALWSLRFSSWVFFFFLVVSLGCKVLERTFC